MINNIRTVLFSIILVFIYGQTFAIDKTGDFISKEEKHVVEQVADLLAATHQFDQNPVWPGYDLTKTPVIITFSPGHIFAFHLKSRNPAWKKIQIKGFEVLFSSEDKWEVTCSKFNPQFPIEGQTAYVFNMDKAVANQIRPYQIFVHERFHQHEFENFYPIALLGNYQDHLNAESIALGKLEECILAEFTIDNMGSDRLEHLRNYLAVHAMRKVLMQPSSIAWEDHQQVMEGLADYVSHKMLDVLQFFPGFKGNLELNQLLITESKNKSYEEHAIKWRHYSIGATLGYALDFLNIPHWKNLVEREGASLNQLLEEAIPLSPNEIEMRVEECKAIYGWNQIFAEVNQSVIKFEDEVSKIVQAYDKADGIQLEIGKPLQGVSGSGSNKRLLYLANGSTVSLRDTLTSTAEDNLWRLQLKAIPYLFKKENGGLEFKIESEANIIIDGHPVSLKDLAAAKQLTFFHEIEIEGKSCHFTSEQHPGCLIVDGRGKLTISYEGQPEAFN
jgi:hypothetical protein